MRTQASKCRGFSLVEVTLALGLVTFCLIAIFSLLPVGLNSAKSSAEEAGAAALIAQIASEIRSASTNTAGQFVTTGPAPLTWNYGSSVVLTNRLSLSGTPGGMMERYASRVEIIAPTNALSSGTALISLAWPAAGTVAWNSSQTNWTGAQGTLSTRILFIARP